MPAINQELAQALRSEVEKLRRAQIEAVECRAEFGKSATTPSTLNLRGIASILADIYQGAENAFQWVAKTTGEDETITALVADLEAFCAWLDESGEAAE